MIPQKPIRCKCGKLMEFRKSSEDTGAARYECDCGMRKDAHSMRDYKEDTKQKEEQEYDELMPSKRH